mmetsp:Transcript_28562/g.42356  ORF Transcript_28562/g.42356 Transcript_28562/m.42356 type:complete len:436 (+) Transcript_28562:50-1357(+)
MSGWQSAPTKSNKPKRSYVGNLNYSSDIDVKLKALFSRSAITVESLEIVPLKQPNTKCYALVQCDVGMAVKCLNGLRFEGNELSVKPEKKQNNFERKKKGMGFGGGWATPAAVKKTPASSTTKINVASSHGPDKITSRQSKVNDGGPSSVAMLSANSENLETNPDDISDFKSRCNISLGSLMGEYGSYDPDYEKMKAMQITEPAEAEALPTVSRQSNETQGTGMLAPNGKSPVHIEIVSFGFKYSVPPQAREGWSHSNPFSPIDCRDLPRCPHHVAKLSGLSHKVKRVMISMPAKKKDPDSDDGDSDVEEEVQPTVKPLLAKSEELSKTVLRAVEEAINEGGHGYAFPLEAKIFLGSEYGRHRSVVLCENLAQQIRTLLRANEGNRITQPVSVSTRHRDVDQKHKDEEAFGKDLQREHNAEMRRKKKEEWLESSW